MPRGGWRPGTGGARLGAGRPKKGEQSIKLLVADADAVKAGQMTPLEYMLVVLNDPGVDDTRRDRMAQAAAPYIHARADAEAVGKKQQRDEAAKVAERGTDWEDLLTAPSN
jgi:hypothetical protein